MEKENQDFREISRRQPIKVEKKWTMQLAPNQTAKPQSTTKPWSEYTETSQPAQREYICRSAKAQKENRTTGHPAPKTTAPTPTWRQSPPHWEAASEADWRKLYQNMIKEPKPCNPRRP